MSGYTLNEEGQLTREPSSHFFFPLGGAWSAGSVWGSWERRNEFEEIGYPAEDHSARAALILQRGRVYWLVRSPKAGMDGYSFLAFPFLIGEASEKIFTTNGPNYL